MNKQIEITGKKIFYRTYGKGKPVMLVHGFGETGDVWKNQITYLKNDFQLIIPDLPGSGESDLVKDMSIEGMAEVIKIIFEAEVKHLPLSGSSQIPPPTGGTGGALIGHSMGGYITLAFASKYPGYLSALGLFHSSAFADTDEKKETRKKGIEFIREHGAFEFLKNATPNLFSPLSKNEKPELIDGFIRSLSNFSDPSLVYYYDAMMQRPDRTELLKTIELPVLFV